MEMFFFIFISGFFFFSVFIWFHFYSSAARQKKSFINKSERGGWDWSETGYVMEQASAGLFCDSDGTTWKRE